MFIAKIHLYLILKPILSINNIACLFPFLTLIASIVTFFQSSNTVLYLFFGNPKYFRNAISNTCEKKIQLTIEFCYIIHLSSIFHFWRQSYYKLSIRLVHVKLFSWMVIFKKRNTFCFNGEQKLNINVKEK